MKTLSAITIFIIAMGIFTGTLSATPAASMITDKSGFTPATAADLTMGRCLEPMRPILPIKPLWCRGVWTQILRCDQRCQCYWEAVCME